MSSFKLLVQISFLLIFTASVKAQDRNMDVRPNVIIILTDDQGYNDVGFNGSKDIPTPNIDRIANNGVKFTNAYVTYPVCGPSRAGLITGRYQDRFGFGRNPLLAIHDTNQGLPLSEETIATVLDRENYQTMAIGKWHLGAHPRLRPLERGFDEFFGFLSGGHRYFPEDWTIPDISDVKNQWQGYNTKLLQNEKRIKETEYLTDALSREAVSFIERNESQPFFLYLAYNAPHTPLQATEKYLNRFSHIENKKRKTYAAMISAVDDGVGNILNKLDELDLTSNTIVFFLSDNGGRSDVNFAKNTPLRDGKGSLFEGGIRVPFAMQWPERIPSGQVFENPVSSLDIFATVTACSKANPKNQTDGVNLVPFLTGQKSGLPHSELFWRIFESPVESVRTGYAVRSGDFKTVKMDQGQEELFNLSNDIGETSPIKKPNSNVKNSLKASYDAWNSEMKDPVFLGLRQGKEYNKLHPERFNKGGAKENEKENSKSLSHSSLEKSVVKTRPNIIWIMLEDWGYQLSCYGEPGIQTPNTDAIAADGIRYTNSFCTAPVCSPSRSAMMTGFHQNFIGANQHRTGKKYGIPKDSLPDGIKPLPQLLKEAGYFTALMKARKTDLNFLYEGELFDGKDWSERKKKQPFFAQITFAQTHRPWRRDKLNPIDINDVVLPPYYPQSDFAKRDWANGLEAMQNVDRQIGSLIKRIKAEGLEDNTIIFLIGDNGRCMPRGKQFLYDGGIQVPIIVKWPKYIDPGQVSDDLVTTLDITKTIHDLAGLEPLIPLHGENLFSEKIPEREFVFAARDKMDDTHDAIRAIRSKEFKLIHNLMPERPYCQYNWYKEASYPVLAELNVLNLKGQLNKEQAMFMASTKPEFELYDLVNDPYELNNLADNPKYAEIKQEYLNRLNQWREMINDQGVSDDFRTGGWPSTYPTRSLENWEERMEQFKPWVFRKPEDKIEHPKKSCNWIKGDNPDIY